MGFPRLANEFGEIELVTERDGLLVFDYKVIKDPGGARQTIVRALCVIGAIGARCPTFTISRRNLASTTGSAGSWGLPDVSFESDMFNHEVHIRCGDPRFAHALIDERMMEWLLLFPSGWGIQISGSRVLVFGQESPRAMQSGPVIEMLNDFMAHVPASVATLYPKGV